MLKYIIVYFLFIKGLQSRIMLDFAVDETSSDIKIEYSGSEEQIITDKDRDLFGIGDKSLKEAVRKYLDETPTSVHLKSPTPWGDLYKENQWTPITRVLMVKSARVKSTKRNPVIVMTQDFENYSSVNITVNTGISHELENSLTTSWSRSQEFGLSHAIEYGIDIGVAKLGGTTTFSFTANWGQGEEKGKTVTIGSTRGVEASLNPGQGITAILTANAGHMEVEVDYTAYLKGGLLINFQNQYKGHYFWNADIDDVMTEAGIENEITITETIRFGFYVDGALKVYNKLADKPQVNV